MKIGHSPRPWYALYENGDKLEQESIICEYLSFSEQILEFFEELSVQVLHYNVSHILCIHVNYLHSICLERLLQMLQDRDYTFVSLDEALQDEAYSLHDPYIGEEPTSWLHRWALNRDLETDPYPCLPESIEKLVAERLARLQA